MKDFMIRFMIEFMIPDWLPIRFPIFTEPLGGPLLEPTSGFLSPTSSAGSWWVFIFFQLFAIYLSRYDNIKEKKAQTLSNKPFWSEAPVVYGIMGLGTTLSIFYQYNDLTLSMALVTVFTMVFVAILAIINILNNSYLE
jgi:hypothetical protein